MALGEAGTRYHPSCVTCIKFFLLTALCSGLSWWCITQERRLLTFTASLGPLGLPVTCLKGKTVLCLHFSTEIFINMTFLFLQNVVGLYTFVTSKSFHFFLRQLRQKANCRHNILLHTTASTSDTKFHSLTLVTISHQNQEIQEGRWWRTRRPLLRQSLGNKPGDTGWRLSGR